MDLMALRTPALFKRRVVGASDRLFHELAVACAAEGRVAGGHGKKFFPLRPVALVTAAALSINDRLMNVRFRKGNLRIEVARITDIIHGALHHYSKAGAVRIVAGGAVALDKRLMGKCESLVLFRCGVACIAKLPWLSLQEACHRGNMPVMAGLASFSLGHCLMCHLGGKPDRGMAAQTDFSTLPRKQSRTFRRVRVVTIPAGAFLKRFVDHVTLGPQIHGLVATVAELVSLELGLQGICSGGRVVTGFAFDLGDLGVERGSQKIRLHR